MKPTEAFAYTGPMPRPPFYKHLYVKVLAAIFIGVVLGVLSPSDPEKVPAWQQPFLLLPPGWGEAMKPFGDAFIKLIKMLIAPIIFCTVVHGIASMKNMRKVGSVGLKALIYFEVVTTAALAIGVDYLQLLPARRRHERRPGHAQYRRGSLLRGKGQGAGRRRLLHAHHPQHRGRRVLGGRDRAGLVPGDPVRLRAVRAGRPRPAARGSHRCDRARLFWHRRDRHEGGADWRFRRDGLHHRQIRPGHLALARQADAVLLRDLPRLHFPGARHHRVGDRLQHLEVHRATSRRSC